MAYVIGCLMAGLSFCLNQLLLKYIGRKVIVSYSPVLEEVSKTFCSYYFGADILATHMIFGLLEAIYDWWNRENEERGVIAVVLSIVCHSLFGVVTIVILNLSGSVLLAIFIASCVHLIWNVTLIGLTG